MSHQRHGGYECSTGEKCPCPARTKESIRVIVLEWIIWGCLSACWGLGTAGGDGATGAALAEACKLDKSHRPSHARHLKDAAGSEEEVKAKVGLCWLSVRSSFLIAVFSVVYFPHANADYNPERMCWMTLTSYEACALPKPTELLLAESREFMP